MSTISIIAAIADKKVRSERISNYYVTCLQT